MGYNWLQNIIFSFSWFGVAELVEKRTCFEPLHSLDAKLSGFHSLNTVGIEHHHPCPLPRSWAGAFVPVGFLITSLTPVSSLHSLPFRCQRNHSSRHRRDVSSAADPRVASGTSRTKVRPWDSGSAPLLSRIDRWVRAWPRAGLFGFPLLPQYPLAIVVHLILLCLGVFTCKNHIINDVRDSKH